MKKAVRLADIAKQLGVSNVTVSKALSGQKGVSEQMRQKIVALADEMGYKQPSALRKQSGGTGYNIGVIINAQYFDKYDSFYLQMYQRVNLEAASNGCLTLLETISLQMVRDKELPVMLKENKVQGVIVIGRLNPDYLDFLEKNVTVPIVFMDFCDYTRDIDAVISDSYYGAYSLTRYLVQQGHRRIAYVGTVLATGSITDRYLGYVKCLMEQGIEVRKDWIIDDRKLVDGVIDEVNYIKLPDDMPTAFLCNCDVAACRLIKKLESAGYNVPQDISVVGYDNYLYPGLCNVELTTYEVDIREMSRQAVSSLLKNIKGEKNRTKINIVEGRLVVRDSVRDISV